MIKSVLISSNAIVSGQVMVNFKISLSIYLAAITNFYFNA